MPRLVIPPPDFVPFREPELEQSLPERFEKQVAKYPHRIAVRSRRHTLTYDAVNRSANRIGRVLHQRTVGNQPVAILMERDAPAILAIIGALKAGKIFVLLDPALPDTRVRQILLHAGTHVVACDDRSFALARNCVKNHGRIVNIDHLNSCADDDLRLHIPPDTISSILYTSGSTGRPKGVVQTHRNELFNVRHHTNSLLIGSEDRLTLLGSYSTGQGMQDIYCSLLNGGAVYPWNMKTDGLSELAKWLVDESITIYHSAVTVFRQFARSLSEEEIFRDVRIVRVGSESVFWRDLELYKRHFSKDCVFVNALSSSEARTFRQHVLNKDSEITGVVPVGYPVKGKNVLILDQAGNPVGPGITGEIAIQSRYLSPGYWRGSKLTAKAFLPDPQDPQSRIYRTGDLGCMSSDGCLSHLGRKDAQVKIRGFRVETHEIELALIAHGSVDQALIVTYDDDCGEKYLTAYVVSARGNSPTVSELRRFLSERLPDYMVPASFVLIDELPLTPTGKIQRSALPKPALERPPLDVPFVAPVSSKEKMIARIWADLLGIAEIGTRDHLLDLGGNSLMAMQIVSRVEKVFGLKIPFQRFLESPTIATLCTCVSPIPRTGAKGSLESVVGDESQGRIPLSFSQERIWFLEQWEPGKPTYNICQAYRLKGTLNIRAVASSLNRLIERHAILRTIFPVEDDRPWQKVLAKLRVEVGVADLRGESEREERCAQLVRDQARTSFDTARGSLLRVQVAQLSGRDHVIIFTVHQLVCDGWSMQIFLREFWEVYQAYRSKRPARLAPLHCQYADFALWQREWLTQDRLQAQLSYWTKRLGGNLPVLNLPTTFPRPAQQSFLGERIPFEWSKALTDTLRKFCRDHDVTMFMTLMTAYVALLHRYTAQDDLIVGFPVANRNWAEASDVIGFFVNTLALRADVSGNPTFNELLSRIKSSCVEAYAHQDLPFERLVGQLRVGRDMSQNPVFQTFFTFQTIPAPASPRGRLESRMIHVDSGTSKVDLTLFVLERQEQLCGYFEYSTPLFDRQTIDRMMVQFETLLQNAITIPNARVSNLQILRHGEREQLLVTWNDTGAEYPTTSSIHDLFELQQQRTPDAVALIQESSQLSYCELSCRANQLARYLMHLGIRPQSLVGICLERSFEMVIGLLGILKAGCAYVPLDPSYPRERLIFMQEDAGLSAVVTQEALLKASGYAAGFSDRAQLPREEICLQRDWHLIQAQRPDPPPGTVHSEDLAYVIYTSGSTGIPNGACGLHKGAVNRFAWMWNKYPFQAGETSCIKTSLGFVDSVWEVFGPLLQGIPSLLISDDTVKDPRLLVSCLSRNHITRIVLVPSLLKALLDCFPALHEHLPDLRVCCVSGEILARELAQQFGRAMPNTVLLNLYGSTEVSADVTCCDMRAVTTDNVIPIGLPIANTRIYILDSDMQPLPIGVPGEIYVGGEGLARGYLNRPERTATQFVPDPFSEDQRSRLYRTGDLGRYMADGNIEFRGRLDHQVKIRGCRVELGEVEAALNRHPAVKESVIVAHAHDSFEINLVGYFVTQQDLPPSTVELRGYLKEKLPAYMVPSLFVGLASLPLTPSGKVDRNALPRPDAHRLAPNQAWLEPRTEVEELVAQVWRELLRLDKVGVFENFFDLGGHSLLATRVVARLGAALGIDLPLRKLFEFPTVAGLAAEIDRLRRERSGASIAPIGPAAHDHPLPLSFSQRRLWFLDKLDPRLIAYNVSASFRITGTLHIPVLERAINEIIKRHETLRTRIVEIDGQPFQEIVSDVSLSLPVVELSGLPSDAVMNEITSHAAEDSRRPYEFSSAPLMRVKLLRFAESDHALILNFHHAVCDGSSLVIFYQELQSLYAAFLASKPSPLHPLAIQYGDYAVWQESWLRSEAADLQLAYWKQQLADWSALNVPTDYSRGLARSYCGAREAVLLSEKLTKAVKELSREQGVTLFMTLLAAFDILLSRHSGQDDIVIGSTIAGRSHHEMEGVIGFFINAIVLRGDLSGNPKFVELLKGIREMCLAAYTHQDLPFEKLVEELGPPRDFNRNPVFDVLFNMADVSGRSLSLTGCEVAKVARPEFSAMFDMVLHAPEVNGRIELAMVYNSDLFSAERIKILLRQFELLLSQAAEEPQKTINRLSLALPVEGANFPDPAKPLEDTWEGAIHEVFATHATTTPGALAATDNDDAWTYAELDHRSSQLANYLRANGSRPNDVMAICAHRSSSLLVALLGVLKAGGVFLIIDPAYPPARLTAHLRIASPKTWLQMAAAGRLPEELTAYLDTLNLSCRLTLPREKQAIAYALRQHPETPTRIRIGANDPAYIAFTSGSTGEPKGVLGRHGPITHFLPWQKEAFELCETDRFCLLSGLAYNHLHRDIFTALYLGATLYIPPPEIVREPGPLIDWLRANEISVLHLTPAFGQLLLTAATGSLPSVRRIFFGGDVLTRRDVMHMRELAPNATIGCFYGATETQRAVGYYEIPQNFTTSESDVGRPVPLGRGIEDVQLLLLNRSVELAGVGELADICIRSPHLAAGYVAEEAGTRQVFITNPFTGDPNDRLYRTGETGRYMPDGNVEWVGRTDRCVSLRGFRVELEEIEAVLKKHPAVRDAAVVLQNDPIRSSENSKPETRNRELMQSLIAYIATDDTADTMSDLLHGYASAQLPEYMVPAHFVILEQLSLSPSGKIDYGVLPSLASVKSQAPRPRRAPRNAIEEKLAIIFRQVLERSDIDMEDDFFRLGGHSLLAAQAAARIREAFGIAPELRSFFDSPTVAGLARWMEGRLKPANATSDAEDKREEIEL